MESDKATPIARWLRLATPEERTRAAALAGTSVNYLYQLAGAFRGAPRVDKAFALEDAFRILHEESLGRLPLITAREISIMHALSGL